MNLLMNHEGCGIGKYTCWFPDFADYSGKIEYHFFKRSKITLLLGLEPILTFRQTNLLEFIMFLPLKVLLSFPFYIPPYRVFSKTEEIGKAKINFDWQGYTFMIQGSTYVLRQHSDNIGSLTKNNCQIARYKFLDSGQVKIDYASQEDLMFVLLFSLLFFASFHANKKWKHTSIIFDDNYAELARWNNDR